MLDIGVLLQLGKRVVGRADLDHEGVDEAGSNIDPCSSTPLGEGAVGRLVAIGLAVDTGEDMNAPVCVLEPFRCPYVLDSGDAAGHLGDGGPVFQIGA